MMTIKILKRFFKSILLLPLLTLSLSSHSGVMTQTLGNGASGLIHGDLTTTLELLLVQGGQDAPFDQGYGHSLFGPSFSGSWIFDYTAITETILSATLTIGIADHDSMASGDQVASYMIDGNDVTSGLNTAFESVGGADTEYNVYSLGLSAATFAGLADGTAAASLGLQGPGLVAELDFSTGDTTVIESIHNPANLIFSTLTIVFEDSTNPPIPQVPEPSTLILFSLGLLIIGRRKLN